MSSLFLCVSYQSYWQLVGLQQITIEFNDFETQTYNSVLFTIHNQIFLHAKRHKAYAQLYKKNYSPKFLNFTGGTLNSTRTFREEMSSESRSHNRLRHERTQSISKGWSGRCSGFGNAIQPGIVSRSKSMPIASTRQGERMMLTTEPSMPTSTVETPASSMVQFKLATWKPVL